MSNFEYANATQAQLDAWALARMEREYADAESEDWERQQRQVRWAEAGGYRAGIARPAY